MSDVVIFTIVQKGKAEKVFAAARNAGSTGGTIFYAHGTAPSRLLSMLGLGDSHKEMIVILTEEEKENAIITAMCGVEKCQGAVWVAPCGKAVSAAARAERARRRHNGYSMGNDQCDLQPRVLGGSDGCGTWCRGWWRYGGQRTGYREPLRMSSSSASSWSRRKRC
ncbi:MAG: hypothetical protein LKE28_05620 [Sphaerochaeta sp.]|jgi:hypothetical protein|nr:hypothetical protein [Sphaerochaeta sp.]